MLKKSPENHKEKICTNCFKSLGIPSCMKIYLHIKKHGATSVTALTKISKLTQPTVSYHLHEMKENGLLTSEKHGKEVLYSINQICTVYNHACVLSSVEIPQ